MAQVNPSHTIDSDLFSAPFFLSPLTSRRTQFWGANFGVLLGAVGRQPSTPNMTGRRIHRTTEALPRRPWKAKSPFASGPKRNMHKEGHVRGAHEVRHGTSSMHVHCAIPQSPSHTGPRIGDREPRTIPTKDLPHQVVLGGGGVVCELSEPKKKAKYAPPPVLHSRC